MRILWLKNNLLHPLDSGGKIRTCEMLRRLNALHEVHFVAFADERREAEPMRLASEYARRLVTVPPPSLPRKGSPAYYARVIGSFADPYPFTVTAYRDRRMLDRVAQLVGQGGYDLCVADFLAMCLNVPSNLGLPKVHFSHNVEAAIWRRHVETERNPLRRLVFERERSRVERFEGAVVRGYDYTIAVSEGDAEHFRRAYGATRVGSVATGVDTDYFSPQADRRVGASIVFVGSMDWMPNVDAVRWLVRDIYPLIKREIPEATLTVVGRSPDESIRALALDDSSIVVTGTVPDIRPLVAAAGVAVVPIRIGGGTRLKIYELMAMGRAVVSTAIGAEGLNYSDGENILIADEPADFSRLVVKALREEGWRREIERRARAFVAARCSWDAVTADFAKLLERARER